MKEVSNNTGLIRLKCDQSQITSLDVSNNTALIALYCNDNQLTSLDVSNNTELETLWGGSNQITTLDVSNNTNITDFHLNNMSTLYKVCVWETFFLSPDDYCLETTGSPNIYFTTDCN